MKALVAPAEPRQNGGYRVCQVEPDDQTFEVAEPFFWTDCSDDVVADQFYYDPADATIKPITEWPAPPYIPTHVPQG